MPTQSITNPEQRATDLLAELKRGGEPILITQHGVPRAYLVDVEGYERLRQRLAILEGLVREDTAVNGRRVSGHEDERPKRPAARAAGTEIARGGP